MLEEAEESECECEEGLPGWMATFADMMTLLMCFFILLLSFAEIDAIRFKKMAESIKDAFGVQKEIISVDTVKGISVVKLEFSASISDPTIVSQIKQETTEEEKERLEVNDGPKDKSEKEDERVVPVDQSVVDAIEAATQQEIEEQAEELQEALKKEINEEMVTVEVIDSNVIIRINEKGSFPSGSADPHPGFMDVLDRIAVAISTMPGEVVVAGHTDNVPISTERFRSNWELSTARAVTVVHALLTDPTLDPERFLLEGHAETDPLVPNDTFVNRALNRRVELIVKRVKDEELETPISVEPDAATIKEETTATPVPTESAIIPVTKEPPAKKEPQIEAPAVEAKTAAPAEIENVEVPPAEVGVKAATDAEPVIAPPSKGEEQKEDAATDEDIQIHEVISVEELI